MRANYDYYKAAFEGVEMPFAFVDLDLFDKNIKDIVQRVGNKSIRIATKSLRCTTLIHRILDVSPQFKGLMCFTAAEAVWLAKQGFDDLLVAYPTVHQKLFVGTRDCLINVRIKGHICEVRGERRSGQKR